VTLPQVKPQIHTNGLSFVCTVRRDHAFDFEELEVRGSFQYLQLLLYYSALLCREAMAIAALLLIFVQIVISISLIVCPCCLQCNATFTRFAFFWNTMMNFSGGWSKPVH